MAIRFECGRATLCERRRSAGESSMRIGQAVIPEFDTEMANTRKVHHRGHVCVYLRVSDIPVPGLYGPSADDPGM